jgi:hypothetical protein
VASSLAATGSSDKPAPQATTPPSSTRQTVLFFSDCSPVHELWPPPGPLRHADCAAFCRQQFVFGARQDDHSLRTSDPCLPRGIDPDAPARYQRKFTFLIDFFTSCVLFDNCRLCR